MTPNVKCDSLLTETPGKSAAYLTDFILGRDSDEWGKTCEWLDGVDTLICEAQYRDSDSQLAAKNAHMTTKQVGQLALDAGVGKLIIQHVSRRYDTEQWLEMLEEARSVFPGTSFPDGWNLAGKGLGSENG
ncbi:MAG: hypothetical protein P1U85_23260 [Verrucomicrobiales bacterium]|nr:hypothetical protein [Verrucomicrobiales bacterium]